MPSPHEQFWTHERYAVVGHSARARFPRLTYGALKARGKTVYPVDPSAPTVEGDRAYADLAALPGPVDALVLEVPSDETRDWVEKAASAGIRRVWIHMKRDTPEALALAREKGVEVCHGTCAVMYLTSGPSAHAVHRFFRKLAGRY